MIAVKPSILLTVLALGLEANRRGAIFLFRKPLLRHVTERRA
jgi:hypothetical protein